MAGKERMRLTDAAIARLRPRAREYTVWDTRVPGLGVRVRPSGGQSYVMLQETDGRSKRVSLGPVSLKKIDEVRRECHARRASPEPERGSRTTRAVPSLQEFVEDEWKQACFDRYKPSTKKGVRSMLAGRILPAFGSKPLDRITPAQVRRWFDAFSRTAPGGANRGLDIFRQIMNFAIASGHIDKSPAQDVKRNRRHALTRFLSREEIARLHETLDGYTREGHRQQADIIRLLLLTGCRRREIVQLRWSEIDDDLIRLADSKTGPRKVPLNTQARRILDRRTARRELFRVSVAARPMPPARSRTRAMVSGPSGGRHRGCPPSRPAPHSCESRSDERRAHPGRLPAARSQQCADDAALRPPRGQGNRGSGRESRAIHWRTHGRVTIGALHTFPRRILRGGALRGAGQGAWRCCRRCRQQPPTRRRSAAADGRERRLLPDGRRQPRSSPGPPTGLPEPKTSGSAALSRCLR